jgi:ribonuclease BN (tRNA processing enzyme)
MKLVPLGVNGYLPINGFHSSCFLALFDDALFMLDAGTGAARLHEPEIRDLIKPYREMHLLLSHYHVDHTAGLYYAFTAFRKGPLHVYAPVCPYIQCDPVEAIRRYFSPPLNSFLFEDTTLQIHPVNTGELEIAGHRVRIWPQKHPGGSVGIRIDDALAYVTDTVVMLENIAHVRGVDMLLHELWLNDEDAAANDKENKRHACLAPVAEFVKATQPRSFMPVHLYPHYNDKQRAAMTREVERFSGVPSVVPVERQVYP